MKNGVVTSIVQIEPEVLTNLVKEVKETIAVDCIMPKPKKKSFGSVDLWNIRRTARTAQGSFRS